MIFILWTLLESALFLQNSLNLWTVRNLGFWIFYVLYYSEKPVSSRQNVLNHCLFGDYLTLPVTGLCNIKSMFLTLHYGYQLENTGLIEAHFHWNSPQYEALSNYIMILQNA